MIVNSKEQTVLIVDDAPDNIDLLKEMLESLYKIKVAVCGEKAIEIASKKPYPDIILLDIEMPGIDGFETCRRLKNDPETADIPVIFVTAKIQIEDERKGLEIGAADYIAKPISPPIVLARVATQLRLQEAKEYLKNQNETLNHKVEQRTHELNMHKRDLEIKNAELNDTKLEIIRRLGMAGEFRDNETGAHVIRMSKISQLIARAAGLGEEFAEGILRASPMHDIGKIGIPDNILLKQKPLTFDEFEFMKTNTLIGAKIIGKYPSKLFFMAKIIALNHHEKWDGTGYPNGLIGDKIPVEARIAAVADVFDALMSERPYKKIGYWKIL